MLKLVVGGLLLGWVVIVPAAAADIDTNGIDALPDGDLTSMNGGSAGDTVGDYQFNNADNSSTSTGNTVSGTVTTGVISGTSVDNVTGFNTILLNTGNNVTMQTLTQVNIILK